MHSFTRTRTAAITQLVKSWQEFWKKLSKINALVSQQNYIDGKQFYGVDCHFSSSLTLEELLTF